MLGMSVSAVADAELGLSKCMPVEKAVLMADLYRAPHLLNYYCLHECPIGCHQSISDDHPEIDRVTLKLLKRSRVEDLERLKDKLVDIAEDGTIGEDERSDFEEIVDYLESLAKVISEIKVLSRAAMRT